MDPQAVAAIATLDDDVRRALFTCVRDAPGPVTREAAAEAVGISRKLAAFHLDKLVAAGLLDARTEAVGDRRVGRTPKVYEPSRRHLEVSLPQREHGLLADVLITA
ncbi:MAG TPA: helix-turn-helix domain-containing protein, partial [Jatrophihabitantaceae bacterium]|nr:helix-turn-helix domain-containing protein [Jatrophihabitantaceae bacterium]